MKYKCNHAPPYCKRSHLSSADDISNQVHNNIPHFGVRKFRIFQYMLIENYLWNTSALKNINYVPHLTKNCYIIHRETRKWLEEVI